MKTKVQTPRGKGVRKTPNPPSPKAPPIIGLGNFDSGIPDLATNKKHMEGFGRDN